jgi:ribosome-binding factor A
LGEDLRLILGELLRDYQPVSQLEGLRMTITEVRVNSNLRFAKIFFTSFGEGAAPEAMLKILAAELPAIQAEVAKRLSAKYMPGLRFYVDDSYERAARVEEHLSGMRQKHED